MNILKYFYLILFCLLRALCLDSQPIFKNELSLAFCFSKILYIFGILVPCQFYSQQNNFLLLCTFSVD